MRAAAVVVIAACVAIPFAGALTCRPQTTDVALEEQAGGAPGVAKPVPADARPVFASIDAEDRFVIRSGADVIHAGPGVRFLIPVDLPLPGPGTPESRDAAAPIPAPKSATPLGPRTGYVGVFQKANGENAFVHVKDARGVFGLRRVSVERGLPLASFVERAVRRLGAACGDTSLGRALASTESQVVPKHETRLRPPGGDATPVPAAGEDLARWAPADRPFIRFRDTEAAMRFVGEADRLAARLRAAAGDGRSFETLRWALHDLLLPSIWNANPGAERGAGECGVVLEEAPLGRSRVVLVMRITDPQLHDFQTRAGVAYESREDHLWKPADDPFPGLRARRNTRRVEGDVEVVSTDERSLDDVIRATAGRMGDGDAWKDARTARPAERDEAFLAVMPALRGEDLVEWLAAPRRHGPGERIARGAVWLAARWTGVPCGFSPSAEGVPADASPLADVRWVRAVTDASGARVECVFGTEAGAERVREILEAAARPLENHGAVCSSNRRELTPLAFVERGVDDLAERCFVVMAFKPVCPCGGRYEAHPVTREVDCTVHGSDRRPIDGVKAPKALLRDLVREGKTVRFLWPIRW